MSDKLVVMDTGVPQGIFLGSASAPAENPFRKDRCRIPAHTGMGSNGTHGKETLCGIGLRDHTKKSIEQ